MRHEAHATYSPLNTLKPVAENVWIVDGGLIRFGLPGIPWPKMPLPTRMTVIRLQEGLFIHSPTALNGRLRAEVGQVGRAAWIVAPNRLHYWWIPDWHAAFPEAAVHLAPRVCEQAGRRIDFDAATLEGETGYPWDDAIATLPVAGSFMTEVVFFHRASRTLVLTDFIENFEPAKTGFFMRGLARMGGALHPDGSMPRDMRRSFARQRPQLKAAVEKMIAWDPERIILAHGKWYAANGTAELRRAFRWLLER